jgi:hypothetical protein
MNPPLETPQANLNPPRQDQDAILPWLKHLAHLYSLSHAVVIGAGNGSGPWTRFLKESVAKSVKLVEADEDCFRQLRRTTEGQPSWFLSQQLIAPDGGSALFHKTSVPCENGLLHPDQLSDLWPRISSRESVELDAITLAQVMEDLPSPADWLFIDCLPALPLLRGAMDFMSGVNVIVARVTAEPSAANADIDSLAEAMADSDFQLLTFEPNRNPQTGHALFVRNFGAAAQKTIDSLHAEIHLVQNKSRELEASNNATEQSLEASHNRIQELEASNNATVESLEASRNRIQELEASNNATGQSLEASRNRNKELEASNNATVQSLEASHIRIQELEASNNATVQSLEASHIRIQELEASNNAAVQSLEASHNRIQELEAANSVTGQSLEASRNRIQELEASNNATLESLEASRNRIQELEASNNATLESLEACRNRIQELEASNNATVQSLEASRNRIKEPESANNATVQSLEASRNRIKELEASNNATVQSLEASRNRIKELEASNNATVQSLEASRNRIKELEASNNEAEQSQYSKIASLGETIQAQATEIETLRSSLAESQKSQPLPKDPEDPGTVSDVAVRFYNELVNKRSKKWAKKGSETGTVPFVLLDSKSLPRCGLHYLKSRLQQLLDQHFSFCEWYQETGCCGKRPCNLTCYAHYAAKTGSPRIRLIKSHDFDFTDPVIDTGPHYQRVIIVRDPIFMLTSWFELDQFEFHKAHLAELGIDMHKIYLAHEPELLDAATSKIDQVFQGYSQESLDLWLTSKTEYMIKFMQKWVEPQMISPVKNVHLVNYDEIDQFAFRIIKPFRSLLPKHLRTRIDKEESSIKDRFKKRSEPFEVKSKSISNFIQQHSQQFLEAASQVLLADKTGFFSEKFPVRNKSSGRKK